MVTDTVPPKRGRIPSRRDFLKATGLTTAQMNLLWSSVLAHEPPATAPAKTTFGRRAPNILLIVNDQERYLDKLPRGYSLPGKELLLEWGTEFMMGMALLVPVVSIGSLSLREIGEAQSQGWFSWLAFSNPFTFVAFVCFFIASLARCKRAPFDLPEAESELVAGFHTEYSGLRWSFFFFAEYAAMFVVSGLAVILFLGAWNSPLPVAWGDAWGDGWFWDGVRGVLFSGPIWFVAKCVFFLYVQIWLRWTLPRVRLDQVLYGCIQVILPLTMLLLLGETLWVWASTSDSSGWATLTLITKGICGLVGLIFTLGFPVIAIYGFSQRRKLVGNLVQDVMPGS